MADREYQRLTGWRRARVITLTPSGRSSLWLGRDHLLKIESSYYTEEYKRFYFRDIQSITVRKTKRREVRNLILGFLAVPAAIRVLFNLVVGRASPSAGVVTYLLVVGIALAINSVLGSTCTAYIRTAVQTEELPSLSRMPRTQK